MLQPCLYSELIGQIQSLAPVHMAVVVPWSDFEPKIYLFADYAAYFRKVRGELLKPLRESEPEATIPARSSTATFADGAAPANSGGAMTIICEHWASRPIQTTGAEETAPRRAILGCGRRKPCNQFATIERL